MEFLRWLGWCSCGDLGLDFFDFYFPSLLSLPLSTLSFDFFFFIECFGFSGCGGLLADLSLGVVVCVDLDVVVELGV